MRRIQARASGASHGRQQACHQRLRARQTRSAIYVCCRTEEVASRPYDHKTDILGCHGFSVHERYGAAIQG